jgi:hypothetical protein
LAIGFLRTPEREISRTELEALIQTKGISKGRVMPTHYAGIYHIEGTRNVGGKSEKFFVTTHLGETEIKSLIDQSAVKTEIPGLGMSGQWVNIVSVLLIAGVAITLVVCQANIGRGKNASVKVRCRRSWIFCAIRKNMNVSGALCPRESCSSAPQEPARRCWQKP